MRQGRPLQLVDLLAVGAGVILFCVVATTLVLFVFQRPTGPLMNSFNTAVGTASATVVTYAVKSARRLTRR